MTTAHRPHGTGYAHIDMSMVDKTAVEFVRNGTPMRLNTDEQTYAVRQMLGQRTTSEIARLIGTYPEEVMRIARATPSTMRCPCCYQRAYHDDGVMRRHIDNLGRPWCGQSGKHHTVKVRSVQDMTR